MTILKRKIKINPQPRQVYFGQNKMTHPEKFMGLSSVGLTNKEPENIHNKINIDSKNVNKILQKKNYYGFDKYNRNLNQMTGVPLGSNPTEAGVLQSGVANTDKNKMVVVNLFAKKLEMEQKEQEKNQMEEIKEFEKNEQTRLDVLASYLLR